MSLSFVKENDFVLMVTDYWVLVTIITNLLNQKSNIRFEFFFFIVIYIIWRPSNWIKNQIFDLNFFSFYGHIYSLNTKYKLPLRLMSVSWLACRCFFSHHSVTVAGIRSPGMRKQTHDDLISNFGETPSDPRCELLEHWFVHFCPPSPPPPTLKH